MSQQSLSVLWVRDGRPGHEKQSLGLIDALKVRYTLQVREIHVQPRGKAILQALFFRLGRLPQDIGGFAPDLIIGTGSHTHFVILALQKRLGGRSVVCMSPMAFIRHRFDLCCVPRHDGVKEKANIVLTDGPPGVNMDQGHHDASKALVLVGGVDEKSHHWDNEAISRDIVNTVIQHPELQWTLTTSPRTPSDFLAVFSQYQPTSTSLNIAPFTQTPPGWLEQQLQATNWVVVTEDSVSMIFEALSAGCRVATIPVLFLRDNKFVRCLRDLKRRNLIVTEMIESNEDKSVVLNEAGRCVEHMIRQPWWPLS